MCVQVLLVAGGYYGGYISSTEVLTGDSPAWTMATHLPMDMAVAGVRGISLHNTVYMTGKVYCTILYCTVLYCTTLYCTVLHCTVPYYIVLYHRRQPEPKYRNDENVLNTVAAEYRQITTGEEECGHFVTDMGLVSRRV